MPFNPPYVPATKSIETTGNGFRELTKFYAQTLGKSNQTFVLDLGTMNHVDANLASVLAAIYYSLKRDNNKLIIRLAGATYYVFKRNGLISYCDGKPNDPSLSDERQSTIPLHTFRPVDGEAFTAYLKNDFFGHRGATGLTATEVNRLTGHFTEVFENVFMHAETNDPVFTCGQYYPQRNELKFTLVDLGCGFLKKIQEKSGGSIKSEALAIQWALLGKSTRDIEKFGPGGGILKAIQIYCKQHNGSLLIVSGTDYCNAGAGTVESGKLACRFNGSIVNLILRNL